MSSFNKPAFYRHFVGHPQQRLLCNLFVNAADLETDLARPDPGHPEGRLALTFTHACLQRFATDRPMRENPDIDFAFAMEKMSSSYSPGLDMFALNPTGLESLQA